MVENALFGMLNWTHRWFVPGHGMTGQEVAEAFWSIFTKGMLSEKNAADLSFDIESLRRLHSDTTAG